MDNKIDDILTNLPKFFCEDILLSYNSESFIMALRSGGNIAGYSLTPEQAKRLAQHLSEKVQAFERDVRPINAEWSPLPKSPIQVSSLIPPKEEGGEK